MTLHLQKLCVGAESIADLHAWIMARLEEKRRQGMPAEQIHVTRSTPQRAAELLDGGSLYWVIRGTLRVRQRLLDIRSFTDADGTPRCGLVLEPVLIPTEALPRRAFQGWRYLTAADAPRDLGAAAAETGLPQSLAQELRELGLL